MNKFIFPLAAFAALFTGNLFAQEAAISNSQNDAATSAYDCVRSVSEQSHTLGVQGGVVTQEFTACTTGSLKSIVLTVKNASENAVYKAELVNNRGEVVDMTRFGKSDLKQQTLVLNMSARVKEGKSYSLQITAPAEKPIAFRYLRGPMGTLWNDGEPVRGQLTGTFGFETRELAEAEPMAEGRGETTPENRGLANQCKVGVNGHDGRVRLNGIGHSTTQSFETCSRGTLNHLTVKVQASDDDFEGRMFVKTAAGEALFSRNIGARDLKNGELSIPMNIRVDQGEELVFGIKTLEDYRLALQSNSEGNVGECKKNGATIEGNLEFTAYIAEAATTEERADIVDTKVTTYPNPFSDRISIRLEDAKDGKAVVQLLDFSGNILRTDVMFVKNSEGEITFETRDIERPGYYALRVIEGDDVKNITIMKR
jgi:hypothetical protein